MALQHEDPDELIKVVRGDEVVGDVQEVQAPVDAPRTTRWVNGRIALKDEVAPEEVSAAGWLQNRLRETLGTKLGVMFNVSETSNLFSVTMTPSPSKFTRTLLLSLGFTQSDIDDGSITQAQKSNGQSASFTISRDAVERAMTKQKGAREV